MSIKVTKKAIRDDYPRIIGLDYCAAQALLEHETPFAYSSRAEGWACDYYIVEGVLISTGYAPLKDTRVSKNYAVVNQYEERARAVQRDDYETRKKEVRKILIEFVAECLHNFDVSARN